MLTDISFVSIFRWVAQLFVRLFNGRGFSARSMSPYNNHNFHKIVVLKIMYHTMHHDSRRMVNAKKQDSATLEQFENLLIYI